MELDITNLKLKRKSDKKLFTICKIVISEQVSVWSTEWYGRHVVGQDCELWYQSKKSKVKVKKYIDEQPQDIC